MLLVVVTALRLLHRSRPKPHVSREAATKAAGQPSSDSSNAGTAKVAPMVQTFRQHFAPVRKVWRHALLFRMRGGVH